MKKIFLLLLITFLVGGCGEEKNSQNINAIKSDQTITIGIDEFAPFGFTDENGQIVGFDVDLAKEAARRMNVEVKFKVIDWDKKEYELSYGNIDMIWNGCDIMEEYRRYMIFSKPYMDNCQVLLVKKGNPKNIHSVEDLAGKIVATQADSSSMNYIEENPNLQSSFADFKTYRRVSEGFNRLNNGEYDALIIDKLAAYYEANKNPDKFEVLDVGIGFVSEFGIGFRRDNVKLRDKVQKVLDEMIADGTAKVISKQWLGADLIKDMR